MWKIEVVMSVKDEDSSECERLWKVRIVVGVEVRVVMKDEGSSQCEIWG